MQHTRFLTNENGAARSSMIFAAAMAVTAFAMISAFASYENEQARTLNDLSDTQYLSSQKLR